MFSSFFKNIFTIFICFFILACSSKECRRKDKIPPMPGYQNMDKEALEINPKIDPNIKTIQVFKYDGSLQCGMGKAIATSEMAKDLGNIKIFKQFSKEDGLMRIQACGTPTGKANVYEIKVDDLKKAKALGFQVWNF